MIAFVATLAAIIGLHQVLTSSLALLEGTQTLAGLGNRVSIERDSLGIPTIQGSNRVDVARALGFIHAQDRFFQMDLLRRRSAGELAAIFGEGALPLDRRSRVHRFRSRAVRVLKTLSAPELAIADAYTAGVNAGLAALGGKPIEYYAMRVEPKPWTSADSILVVYSMYLDLNDAQASRESAGGLIYDFLGPEMHAFLEPSGTSWDATRCSVIRRH